VFAEEVETTVKSHPAVFDAVVCGRPSARWGQEVTAVVRLRDGATVEAAALRAHCRDRLADFKVPKSVVFVDEVVRSPSGKADYRWAQSMVAGPRD
jgi:acyl-CoA synthetase (AMP-forming)/AMP-acid ligase II